eukprot:453160-Rhodomonas_salina.1
MAEMGPFVLGARAHQRPAHRAAPTYRTSVLGSAQRVRRKIMLMVHDGTAKRRVTAHKENGILYQRRG